MPARPFRADTNQEASGDDVSSQRPIASTLRLIDVRRGFGAMMAVDGVSLDIQPGELVSLLGPSGCGKTTMLRMLAGFLPPTAGRIEMDGQTISSPGMTVPPERRQMSMIFQSYAVWPNMTVAENVAFGLKLRSMSRATIAKKVRDMLELVKLAELADRYPGELSGGQQQRVALARAMVIQPRVLLLDEPLSNLDAALREEMRFEIRRLHDAFRFTTVYVTHDQSEAMVTSDRIAVMKNGRIEQIDRPYSIYNEPKTRFVAEFIGRTNLITGTVAPDEIVFNGFAIRKALFGAGRLTNTNGTITFSLRPQSIEIRSTPPNSSDGQVSVTGALIQRTYLGDSWDYLVQPAGGDAALRISAPPAQMLEVGVPVWLRIDPRQMAAVE
ncbi:ABC transporter ATP-binding protein [Pseudaminobacter sp. 19-2017]|uniref:ABC transporter ATP-binding protein n=1 Tax=Pseudaminobacter soli (ex Zhang et al. 2022) TaxID=2831468 RepID=A0A942DYB4_9HYPH|nr:ABC transporter ATP-binding protein [Pseudaminobacter soli]MBS3649357.1 ABC transporter ATP-binding protein [Pseudaminobacter soli]